jgi:succinate-semialdehyde dehydrogenase/glutarate-semialdehyde dehydrogenase
MPLATVHLIATVNPASGETLESFEPLSETAIEEKLQRATAAFKAYRRTPFSARTKWMTGAAEILERAPGAFAGTITTEMGKTLRSAVAEVRKCAWVCRYYAENAEAFLGDETFPTDAAHSYVRYQPLGPVLAVMPWNFP